MKEMLVELVAFSIVGVAIVVVGIVWHIISSIFGKNHSEDISHETTNERDDSKKA